MAVYLIVGRIAGRVRFLVYFLHSEKSGSLPLYNLRDRESGYGLGGVVVMAVEEEEKESEKEKEKVMEEEGKEAAGLSLGFVVCYL